MPSPAANTSIVITGNIREFSDFADNVDLNNVNPTNLQTRMLGGDDIVSLSNINLGGWSNNVNGNNNSDTFTAKAGSQTRDYVLGGPETDFIDLSNSTGGAD
jgi:hypothetical protein